MKKTILSLVAVSFLAAFFIEGMLTSFPKLSNRSFTTKELFFNFPSLHSKLFLSALPSMFAHHKSVTELLTIACVVCTILFRFKTISTPNAELMLSRAVSTKFFDVASLAVLSGTESKFLGVLSLPILLSLVIIGIVFKF